MHPEREHRNLELATADLYLFGTIRKPVWGTRSEFLR
nr:MAG TPA: hypothetical protein [Herelleviridae sp.]